MYCPTMSTKPLLTWWNFSCITSMCVPEACRGDRTLMVVSSDPTKTNGTTFSLWCKTRMLSILKEVKKISVYTCAPWNIIALFGLFYSFFLRHKYDSESRTAQLSPSACKAAPHHTVFAQCEFLQHSSSFFLEVTCQRLPHRLHCTCSEHNERGTYGLDIYISRWDVRSQWSSDYLQWQHTSSMLQE